MRERLRFKHHRVLSGLLAFARIALRSTSEKKCLARGELNTFSTRLSGGLYVDLNVS